MYHKKPRAPRGSAASKPTERGQKTAYHKPVGERLGAPDKSERIPPPHPSVVIIFASQNERDGVESNFLGKERSDLSQKRERRERDLRARLAVFLLEEKFFTGSIPSPAPRELPLLRGALVCADFEVCALDRHFSRHVRTNPSLLQRRRWHERSA